MIEMTFEEATVESLGDAAVIMAVGVGDRHMSNVLLGRKEFARVAGNPAMVAETKIVRVKVNGEDQLDELKCRVQEAQGGLDPDVKEADVKAVEAKIAERKKAAVAAKKAAAKKEKEEAAKAKAKAKAEDEEGEDDDED
ncbi:MAG TPA: hypothetical protein P5307_21535 [Pirellulaceae bacterium]|nr:hypothetical protein [Planctomycetales bacterium]MCB9937434.1 hypothetical protein [Planctomycetaceae bacterium]HRX81672.1 hypothetical protein [Pirellulaceae bacterium]